MLAVDTTAEIFLDGQAAFEEESDLELAEHSIAANLKVLEGMLKSSPNNETLLVLCSKSYGGYAFGFIEDKSKKRAEQFYLRGRDYALHVLEKNSSFKEALHADFETFEKSLENFDQDDVSALFWTAYNWGNWMNLNLNSPEAIAIAPRVERMMKKVLELDEGYFFAGPHLFYGIYFGARPPMLGGDKNKSRHHFEMALKLTKRKFLMTQVLYAQYYAVQHQDQVLFQKLLQEVIKAKDSIYPEQNLITQLAKRKARRLLENEKNFF